MVKEDIIQFRKVVTYSMPEDNWDDAQKWYQNVYDNIYNLNSTAGSQNISITSTYIKTEDVLLSALQSRIDNKNNPSGDFGYGKCMKEIIGEYHISLDDKEGYEKKVNTLSQILDVFNQDPRLTNYNPLKKKEENSIFEETTTPEEAANIALKVLAVENPQKMNVGAAMGFISKNFPHLKSQMSEIPPLIGKSLTDIRAQLNEGKGPQFRKELESKYPLLFVEKKDGEPTKLEEPISYIFKFDDIEPSVAYFEIDEEVYEIPLADLIKMMSHDKEAYHFLNQHKPGGPQWPQMAGTDYYLVISNDPFMNMTKSSGRFWERNSCERYNSYDWNYAMGPMSDVLYGNCVVFAFVGSDLPEGWPQIQPINTTSDSKKKGALLGRQNIKWGYKNNEEGNIGLGLDPTLYPRGGAIDKLLTKALATILSTTPYFNYENMRTPYYYKGHCDVGSGTGNLTYSRGNGCITDISAPKVNPDVIVANNENIGYVAFERLTRPIIDVNVKMILAQNPNIWAIDGNEAGIGRLIRTKNLDIIRFLVASETADPHALLGITNIIPEVDPTWEDISARSSLPFLIANHPNSTPEIHARLLELHPGYQFEGKKYDALEVLYGGVGYDNTSHTPYVCNGDLLTINKLLKKIRRKGKKNKTLLSKPLLFAPHLDKEGYLMTLNNILEGIDILATKEEVLANKIKQEVALSYSLPLCESQGWAFNDNPYSLPFSISKQRLFSYPVERQFKKAGDVVLKLSQGMEPLIIESLRDQMSFNLIWRQRKKYQIPPYLFTRYSRSILDFHKPSPHILFDSRQLIECLKEGYYAELRYVFIDGENKIIRKEADPTFVSQVLENNDMMENMGWGLISLWLTDPIEHFVRFKEIIYERAFGELYLGDGKFAPAPDNPFELYSCIQDIAILEESAIDMVYDEGGLIRNSNLPPSFQKMLINEWATLSEKYGGSYGEYIENIYGGLCENPNLDEKILGMLYELEYYNKPLSKNPNTPSKYLFQLFDVYPSWVLTNPSLNEAEFNNLWNSTLDVLSTQVDENPDRLFDAFRDNSVLERQKGSAIRKSIKQYLEKNNWIKYWRGGNVKKGNFKQFYNQNLYSEGVADYPIIPKHKSIVAKFWDDPEKYLDNKIYHLYNIEKLDEYNLLIEGNSTSWSVDGKRETKSLSERVGIDTFFNYIPEVERGDNIETTNEEGEVIEINAPRWTIDNIFVFTDVALFEESVNLPNWRFEFNQEDCDRIIKAYITRGENIGALLDILTTPIITSNYSITQEGVLKIVDELRGWNKNIIDKNLDLLLKDRGRVFSELNNIPLTGQMLNVSLAQTDQELEEKYDQPNLKLGDLIPIQIKILGVPNLPISYLYAILNTSLNPQVLSEARKIREARAREYIAHYRKLHPAVVRS